MLSPCSLFVCYRRQEVQSLGLRGEVDIRFIPFGNVLRSYFFYPISNAVCFHPSALIYGSFAGNPEIQPCVTDHCCDALTQCSLFEL